MYKLLQDMVNNYKNSNTENIDLNKINKINYIETTNYIEEAELKLKIKKALRQMPDKCQKVFELKRYSNLKIDEIAKKLDISTKNVESQIVNALKIISNYLN